ncbi:MAG: hypothetical protein ACK41E_01695 [Deinococcales bacterium]
MKKLMFVVIGFFGAALAQTEPAFEVRQVALPLVSVGDSVGAGFGLEDYRLVVSGSNLVQTVVEIYSPNTNSLDYTANRNTPRYFGDELYGENPNLKTTFILREQNGRVLARRTFDVSEQHDIQRFFTGVLRPGNYRFQVESKGNGKNAFAVRASNNVRLEASEFTVNLRGEADQDQLVGFIDVPQNAKGQTIELSNYDADGEEEMGLTLITPDGASRRLTVSPDAKWVSDQIPVSEASVGRWRVVSRTLSTSKQFSNAFGLRVRLGNEALYTSFPGFESPTNVKVNIKAVSCGAEIELPTQTIRINGNEAKTGDIVPVSAGRLEIQAPQLAGARLKPFKAVAIQDQTTEINLEYLVLQRIVLTPKPIGSNGELTTTVSTQFPYPIPTKALLELPEGVTTSAQELFSEALISADNPMVWTVPISNSNPNPEARAIARLARECGGSHAISAVR